MLTQLLVIILVAQMDDVDLGAFNYDAPKPAKLSAPNFPSQTLPKVFFDTIPIVKIKEPAKIEKIFVAKDKFGKEWENTNEELLYKNIDEVNKKPFVATDKFGQLWECQDKDSLDNFIIRQNEYYNNLYNQQNYCKGPTCNTRTR